MTGTLIGRKVGDYEIIARVGSGGMGAVFEAKHPVIGKRIAVKVLHPAFMKDPQVLERFLYEAKAVNAIGHPAIVDIFSVGQMSDGLPYFLMEFLKGRPLSELLKKQGPLAVPQALDLTAQLLEVLDHAHRAGVVHRDLKPPNLFVEERPPGLRLRVLDFGIAKSLTSELRQVLTGSAILGTPGYMSPEQVNSQPVTPQTDLYSVGAVLFEMLTGRPIFVGQNIGHLLIKALSEDAPAASSVRPELPAAVDAFVAHLLKRSPAQRPGSAAAALATVNHLLGRAAAPEALAPRGEGVFPALVPQDVVHTEPSRAAQRRPRPSYEVETKAVPAVRAPETPSGSSATTARELDPVESRSNAAPLVVDPPPRPARAPSRDEVETRARVQAVQPAPLDLSRTTVEAPSSSVLSPAPKQGVPGWLWALLALVVVATGAAVLLR